MKNALIHHVIYLIDLAPMEKKNFIIEESIVRDKIRRSFTIVINRVTAKRKEV